MKHFSLILSTALLSPILTVALSAGMFSNSVIAMNSAVAANTATASNSQENSPTAQTNIRGQLQPTSASAPVDKGWFIDGSFLYWNAKVDGYQFAEKLSITGLSTTSLPTSVNAKAKLETPTFDSWDPGLQLGIGYIFPQREQWCVRLSWTHFNTDNEHSITTHPNTPPDGYLLPTLYPVLTGTLADRASSHWNMHFNTLDLELSRQFFIGKWLSFKPRMGLRAAWIEQHFRVNYHSVFLTAATAFSFDQLFRCRQEYEGIGLKFGTDLQFYITRAWSILGNLSTSLLWGTTELKQKATGRIFVSDTDSFPESLVLSKTFDKLRTNLEGQLGLQWQTYYHQGKYRFAASALYSIGYWFRQNLLTNQIVSPAGNLQQPAVVEANTNGDLQLQGLNIQLEFDF
ncbi:MAG: hypothetical protein JSR39_03625 [Verrucomicrobia bacterium]|nr:hypothetical protein [Verrucomicrobiota bacterium]